MKASIIRLAALILHWTGGTWLLHRIASRYTAGKDSAGRPRLGRKRGDSYQILNYHRVDRIHDPFFLGAVDPADFENHIAYLMRRFKVLPLGELHRRAQDGLVPENAVAITFDDGYADNYRHAFPILRKYGVPSTLFIATGCIDGREPLWYDKVFYAFKKTSKAALSLPRLRPEPWALEPVPVRLKSMMDLVERVRYLPEAERVAVLEELYLALAVTDFTPMADLMLTWDKVREMQAGGIDIQAHTVTHPILTKVPRQQLDDELSRSKKRLEDQLQKEIRLFAYPNGKPPDFNPEVAEAVRRHGFDCAVTTVFGKCALGDDPYTLKRATPWFDDLPRFSLYQTQIHLSR